MTKFRASACAAFLLTCIALLAATSCSTTRQSGSVRESGFLSDYGRLESDPVGGNSWADPEFELFDYAGLFVPEIEFWLSEGNESSLSKENAERLASLFRAKTIEKLQEQGWRIVEEPGERTVSVRLALTELEGANRYGNIITSVPYVSTAAIQALAITSDVNVFVGQASTEVQVVDSSTGKVLAEGLDRRVGAHSVVNIGSTWGDVEDAIEIWSGRIARGLSKLQ